MEVDDKLLRQIRRQLRTIKLMLAFFTILILIMFAMLGYIAYRAEHFEKQANQKITNIENKAKQTLNPKQQYCNNTPSYLSKSLCQ